MKKSIKILAIGFIVSSFIILVNSCVTTQLIQEKGGSQLWSENCIRCHTSPTPSDLSDEQWVTAGMHMRLRANLTEEETNKIIEFLQSAN